ncbi:MAG TPA: universal stress protein [Actinomycetota bacterium]|nr:universal stress protein [Actinomycetota bacterium]
MNTVIAAIDNSAAAGPVLDAALALAPLFEGEVEALHVTENGFTIARQAAASARLPLRTMRGPTAESLVEAGAAEDVVALVVGTRGMPGGRYPAGRTALQVITTLGKPLVMVPPASTGPHHLERVLVPLEGTAESAHTVRSIVEMAARLDLEVVVLHVATDGTIPRFEDQPHHETEAWALEFVARYAPSPTARVRLELRAGVPGEEVVGVARDVAADLVILGWSQDLSPDRAQVVREVLGHSPAPVLLLPAAALSSADPVAAGRHTMGSR